MLDNYIVHSQAGKLMTTLRCISSMNTIHSKANNKTHTLALHDAMS